MTNIASPSGSYSAPSAAPPSLALLAVLATTPSLASNILLPSLPAIRSEFDTTTTTVQLTISVFFAGLAFGQILMGSLSDRFGRRPVILVGVVLFVVGCALASFANSIGMLLVARLLQALGGGAGAAISRAVVRDSYPRDRSAAVMGYLMMAISVGPLLGPALGGIIEDHFGWRVGFETLTAVFCAVFALVWFGLEETNPLEQRTSGGFGGLMRNFAILAGDRTFRQYCLTLSLSSSVYFSFIGAGHHVATHVFGLSPSVFGFSMVTLSLGFLIGGYSAGRVVARFGIVRAIWLGNAVTLVGLAIIVALLAAGVNHPLSLFLPMVIIGTGNGALAPTATAGAVSVRPELAGAASGLTGFLQIGVGAVTTVLMGILIDAGLWDGTAWVLVASMAVFGVLCFFASRFLPLDR